MIKEIVTPDQLRYIINHYTMLSTVNLSLATDMLDSYDFKGNGITEDPALWVVESIQEIDMSINSEIYYNSHDSLIPEIKAKLVERFIHDIDAMYADYILKNVPCDYIPLTGDSNIIDLAHHMLVNFDEDFKNIPVQGPIESDLILYIHPANMSEICDVCYKSLYTLDPRTVRKVVSVDGRLMLNEYIVPDDYNIWGRDLRVPINVSSNIPENCLILASKSNLLFDMREAVLEESVVSWTFMHNNFNFKANTNYGVRDLKGIQIVKFLI